VVETETLLCGFCGWGVGLWSSPSVLGRVVYIGGRDSLYALDVTTGNKLWRFETGSYVVSSPAVSDGVVYFTATNGYLYALK